MIMIITVIIMSTIIMMIRLMRLIMKVKMAKKTVMTMISNKPTYNTFSYRSRLEKSDCTDWTTIFQSKD